MVLLVFLNLSRQLMTSYADMLHQCIHCSEVCHSGYVFTQDAHIVLMIILLSMKNHEMLLQLVTEIGH